LNDAFIAVLEELETFRLQPLVNNNIYLYLYNLIIITTTILIYIYTNDNNNNNNNNNKILLLLYLYIYIFDILNFFNEYQKNLKIRLINQIFLNLPMSLEVV